MKKVVVTMNHHGRFLTTLLLIVLLQLSLIACADIKWSNKASSNYRSYTVTVYSGSDVIREWHNIRRYTVYESGLIDITVDGKDVSISGGTVIIERESD